MNKKILSTALLCLSLTACTIEVKDDSSPATTTTVAATTTTMRTTTTTEYVPPTTAYFDRTQVFLDYIYQETDLDIYMDDSTIIGIANVVCDGARSGLSGDDILRVILESATENGLSDSQIQDLAILSGAGVATFCPEYNYIFN